MAAAAWVVIVGVVAGDFVVLAFCAIVAVARGGEGLLSLVSILID